MTVRNFELISGPWELWASDTAGQVDTTFDEATFTHLGEFDLKFDSLEMPMAEDRSGHSEGRTLLTQIIQGMNQALEGVMLETGGNNDTARAIFYGEDENGVLELGEMPRVGHQSHRVARTMFAVCTPDPTSSIVYYKTTMDWNFQRSIAMMAGTKTAPIRRILLPYRQPTGTIGTGDEGSSSWARNRFWDIVDLTSAWAY